MGAEREIDSNGIYFLKVRGATPDISAIEHGEVIRIGFDCDDPKAAGWHWWVDNQTLVIEGPAPTVGIGDVVNEISGGVQQGVVIQGRGDVTGLVFPLSGPPTIQSGQAPRITIQAPARFVRNDLTPS